MQFINPFLRSFFQSSLPSQCTPIDEHIILVPTTSSLWHGRDADSGNSYFESTALSPDFLASHVIRIHTPFDPAGANPHQTRNKTKLYSTLNGGSLVLKDSTIYTNKGFRRLAQAQLLSDDLLYLGDSEFRPWLIYYISKPLIGVYETILVLSAAGDRHGAAEDKYHKVTRNESHRDVSSGPSSSRGLLDHTIDSLDDVFRGFPLIARWMRPHLDQAINDFTQSVVDWAPPITSRRPSSASLMSQASSSLSNTPSIISSGQLSALRKFNQSQPRQARLDHEEVHLRKCLEIAVSAAIDRFQKLDKRQLQMLGSATQLTGATIEIMIEQHIAEQLHESLLFPRLCNSRKIEDVQLENRLHSMQYVDLAQVGITLLRQFEQKKDLASRVARAVQELRKTSNANTPHQMLQFHLRTQRCLIEDLGEGLCSEKEQSNHQAASISAMNADTLISLLLITVIRAQVRHLHAQLAYMRGFTFFSDIENGECGYVLSTLDAVLTYLTTDGAVLKQASQANKRLFQAVRDNDLALLKTILTSLPSPSQDSGSADEERCRDSPDGAVTDPSSIHEKEYEQLPTSDQRSDRSGANDGTLPSDQASTLPIVRARKTVSMDPSSLPDLDSSLAISRSTTFDSSFSHEDHEASELSVMILAQIQDKNEKSLLMQAVESGHLCISAYLYERSDLYPIDFVLQDSNAQQTSLLSAAVQNGREEMASLIFGRVQHECDLKQLVHYLSQGDSRGRAVGHYFFHCPWLLTRIGSNIDWLQKDDAGQTPLMALCRCYDHTEYEEMVRLAIDFAVMHQADGQPLHLQDHIDDKGNTLLHIVHDYKLADLLLRKSDIDVNAMNLRGFTPLMSACKYARLNLVRLLIADERVDTSLKDARDLTAVELAKNDETRNQYDDFMLMRDEIRFYERRTAVVRVLPLENGTLRVIIKSAARLQVDRFTITTCRRSLLELKHLLRWLAIEHPYSWIPNPPVFRFSSQLPSRPARAVLQDARDRLDLFLQTMISHPTFGQHELLWEFILLPEIIPDMMAERCKTRARLRVDNAREEFRSLKDDDVQEISAFVEHASLSVGDISRQLSTLLQKLNFCVIGASNIHTAWSIFTEDIGQFDLLTTSHLRSLSWYTSTFSMLTTNHAPHPRLFYVLLSSVSAATALKKIFSKIVAQVNQIQESQKMLSRQEHALRRPDRWPDLPLGILDDTKRNARSEALARLKTQTENLQNQQCELAYSRRVVADELSAWQESHSKQARTAIRDFAKSSLIREKERLAGMQRAQRNLSSITSRVIVE